MGQECAKRIAKVSADAKLEVDEETYLNQFKPHLMDVVFAWANGATFAQICKMTDVFEGTSFMLMSGQEVTKGHVPFFCLVTSIQFNNSIMWLHMSMKQMNILRRCIDHSDSCNFSSSV